MKIAVDISPISAKSLSAHKVRGVGSYINLLANNLEKYDKKNSYSFIEDGNFPEDADIIHYPYFDPFFITLPFLQKKKCIVTVHDLTPLVFKDHFPAGIKGNLKWFLQKQLLKKASLILADSNASKKDIQEMISIPESKVKTVYLAAGDNFKKISKGSWQDEVLKKYSLPKEFALYVGDGTWNKNLPNLIEAFKQTNHSLVLIGKIWGDSASDLSDNLWNEDLKRAMAMIEGDKRFIKLGFISDEDIVKIYNLSTCLVLPSIYEGFGLPVLEAMSCGVPVVTTKEGSLYEVGGDAACYVDPYDVNDIIKKIEELFKNKNLREDLSKKGIMQAKKFTIKKTIEETVNAYESL